jgi:hypothetical protein
VTWVADVFSLNGQTEEQRELHVSGKRLEMIRVWKASHAPASKFKWPWHRSHWVRRLGPKEKPTLGAGCTPDISGLMTD